MTSCQAFYCTNEKGKCENDFFVITNSTLVNTSTTVREKEHACIKQDKSDSYLTTANHVNMKLYPPLPL